MNKEEFEEFLFSTENIDNATLMGEALIDKNKFDILYKNCEFVNESMKLFGHMARTVEREGLL